MIISGYEVFWDDQTLWVNAPNGMSVGRYSKRAGIDLHRADQLDGKGICLDCEQGPGTPELWGRFCAGLQQHYNLTLPPRAHALFGRNP